MLGLGMWCSFLILCSLYVLCMFVQKCCKAKQECLLCDGWRALWEKVHSWRWNILQGENSFWNVALFQQGSLAKHDVRVELANSTGLCIVWKCGYSWSAKYKQKDLTLIVASGCGVKPFTVNQSLSEKLDAIEAVAFWLFQHHEDLTDGDSKPVCPICKAKFSTVANLKRHMKVHTGTKDNVCPVCCKLLGHLCV